MTTPHVPRDDLAAALAARRELGPDYDDAFVESLATRIEETLAARQATAPGRRGRRDEGGAQIKVRQQRDSGTVLAIVSLIAAVPLSGIGAGAADMAGVLAVWTAIILLNIVHGIFR